MVLLCIDILLICLVFIVGFLVVISFWIKKVKKVFYIKYMFFISYSKENL